MPTPLIAPQPRIGIVDALRGSALAGILLLHSIEHFDFLRYPPFPPAWLRTLDLHTKDIAFFLFGGKSYAIFAMMFGLSFFLIVDRAAKRGVDFRWRFLWRLGVLAIIGYIHSLLYCGDILSMLAVMGLPLVLFYNVDRRILAWVSFILLLQVPFLWQLGRALLEQGYAPPPGHSGRYYGPLMNLFANNGLSDVVRGNAVNGNIAKWWWSIDNGRCLQMWGLFVLGLWLGRSRVFETPAAYVKLATRALIIGAIGFAIFYTAEVNLNAWLPAGSVRRVTARLVNSYGDFFQMLVWAGGFVLLYHFTRFKRVLELLVPFGRMSLTCYITQALIWVPFYYHFGLGMFRHLGQFYSILCGAGFLVLQIAVAHWWIKRFAYGPFEWLWRCGTLLTFKVPFRRPAEVTQRTPSLSPAAVS